MDLESKRPKVALRKPSEEALERHWEAQVGAKRGQDGAKMEL